MLDIIILVYLKLNSPKDSYSSKLFIRVMAVIAAVSAAEALSWLTSEPGNTSQITLHYWSNMLFLATTSLPAAFALSYLDYKIFHNEEKSKKRFYLYMIPTYVSIGFAIVNLFDSGIMFYIDSANQYHRGIGINVSLTVMYVFFVAVLLYFFRFRNMITGRLTSSIIILFFIPVIGALLQTLFYGVTTGMPSYTLAAFLLFLLIEKDEMGKDELTGLYTRPKMEARLKFKLKANEPFTLIIADLDGFKNINDTYGHSVGDQALKTVADVLHQVINLEDMVCRYGGDEFLILIEFRQDICDKIIDRIDHALEKYSSDTPYKLKLSYGYEFVTNPINRNMDDLIHSIDKEMYKSKEEKVSKLREKLSAK